MALIDTNVWPAALQPLIQTNYLSARLEDTIVPNLGFREVAERRTFPNGVGQTVTMSREGFKAPLTTPLNPLTNTGLDNGITPTEWGAEQFTVTLNQYGDGINLNCVSDRIGIANRFSHNISVNKRQALTTLDRLARDVLYAAYLSGNTFVTTTLGSPNATIAVDDTRGFVVGQLVVVGAGSYTISSIAVDGSNTSTTPNGTSGTLTMSASVSTANGTVKNAVVSPIAAPMARPNARTSSQQLTTADTLTMSVLLDAKAKMRLNNVPTFPDGTYHVHLDAVSARQLFADADFRQLYQGATGSNAIFRAGDVGSSQLLGLRFFETTEAYTQTLATVGVIRRPIIAAPGALIEADFEGMAELDTPSRTSVVTVNEDIAYVTQAPLDRLSQIVKQSWYWIGGFCVPTDLTANPTVIGSASNAQYKRAVVIEHIG